MPVVLVAGSPESTAFNIGDRKELKRGWIAAGLAVCCFSDLGSKVVFCGVTWKSNR